MHEVPVTNTSGVFVSSSESTYRGHYSELDTLAKASEIAGIPYQHPGECSVHLRPEYKSLEHLYQLPPNTHQPVIMQNYMNFDRQIQNRLTYQVFDATSDVPPPDFQQYSHNSEISKHYSTSAIPSLPTTDGNVKDTNTKVNHSDSILSSDAYDNKSEQSKSNVSELGSDIIESSSNKMNDIERVSKASSAVIEKEHSSVSDETVNYTKNSDAVVKAGSECSINADCIELNINGSILKIPVLKKREEEKADNNSNCNSDGNDAAELVANDTNNDDAEQAETSQNDLNDETNLEQTQEESTTDKETDACEKVDDELVHQEDESDQKRTETLSGVARVVYEKLESEYLDKIENKTDKEKKKIFNHKHKKRLIESFSEETKQKQEMDNERTMSPGVKKYLTRLKAKKELLTKSKMKKLNRKQAKTSVSLENDVKSKQSKMNKNTKQSSTSKDRHSDRIVNKEKENMLKGKRLIKYTQD